MEWQNVKLNFLTLIFLWMCGQVSCEVDVICWWDRTLPLGSSSVLVVCPVDCSLCQLNVIERGLPLPSTCASDTLNFTIAEEQRENISCTCRGKAGDTCRVTVRGGYPPSTPSRPECVIEEEDIECTWTTSRDPVTPTVYTLHWEDYDGKVMSIKSGVQSVVIQRTEYEMGTEMTAWVTAENMLGRAESNTSDFNTGHIMRPDPPNDLNNTSLLPLEIVWDMYCEMTGSEGSSCEVQHRKHGQQNWTKEEDHQATFLLEDSQPFTRYSFRVRCHCGYEERVMSHWSSVYNITTPPAAPVGLLDVWSDCPPNSDKSSCNVYWKEMPVSQARGEISNYVVMLKFENGTELKRESRRRRDVAEQRCPAIRRFPLQPGIMGVYVSANTSMGTSEPTLLPFPHTGQTVPEVELRIVGKERTLDVSWSVYPEFSESVLECVLQYESVGPDAACLNWTRVNTTQRSVTLTGDFRDYTAYNVSLFAVYKSHSSFLKSAIGYTRQAAPPEVPEFHVMNISDSSATLSWSSIPVRERKGVVLHYLVGVNETGLEVSSSRTVLHLSGLQASRQYQVWLCAVSEAGEGVRSKISFTTHTHSAVALIVVPVIAVLLVFLIAAYVLYRSPYCLEKIPDPINSKSFKHLNFQHVWPRVCPPSELTLKISELEIVENPETPTPEAEGDEVLLDVEPTHFQLQAGHNGTDGGGEKWADEPRRDGWEKDYSEMVDSDEEEEEWWEQSGVSDYERHFMPSVEAN